MLEQPEPAEKQGAHMHVAVGLGKGKLGERLERKGVSRRDFLKYCGALAVLMGLGPTGGATVAHALTKPGRPSVVYLHNAECTGCSEALLRASNPFIDDILFDTISLDYHETLMAAAGHAAEEALEAAVHAPEGFYCIVEGAIPTANEGKYGYVAGRTMLDICSDILPRAKAVIAYGTCACFGGIQAAAPNPTRSKSVNACFADKGIAAINVPGCPPPSMNLVGTVTALLGGMKMPLDHHHRPLMFYGQTVHELCDRQMHFSAGEFARSFDSEEARKGWCLYLLGCRGPITKNNCPHVLFNDTNWPVDAGHPCIGCSEPGVWGRMTPFYEYADPKPASNKKDKTS